MSKVKEQTFYVCGYCQSVFDSKDMALMHESECLQNYDDVHTCVSCKHATINLVSPTNKNNGYASLRLQNELGVKAYLTCGKGTYNGKLSEDKILREDKQCYEPMEEGEMFIVNKTDSYLKYKELEKQIDEEQGDINDGIKEYWEEVKLLKEQGLKEEEIVEHMKVKYKEE